MRKIQLLILCFCIAFLAGNGKAFAFSKNEQDCSKCHTLNAEQAKKTLDGLIPNTKILSVQPGPVKGLWEIGFEVNNQKSIMYLDYSLKYAVARANIISLKDKKNLTEESFLRINKVDLTGFPYKNALVMGDKNAKNRVIVFDDPD